MRDRSLASALGEIHALYSVGTQTGLNDRELLDRFVTNQGEVSQLAFMAIVRRHGPMVLRVCQQVLSEAHESEDAFQATFLILVRKAGSLRDRGSVGPWLFGVASRVAARSRAATARRLRNERQYVERQATRGLVGDRGQSDDALVLHDEVRRLPERFRTPVVLCYLEGMTLEEAAAQLGWPVGTVASRLARARERLRGQLTRRGVVVSTALSTSLAANASAVPPTLLGSTVEAAVRLAEGRATTVWAITASMGMFTKNRLGGISRTNLKIGAAILTTACGLGTIAGDFASRPPRSLEIRLVEQPGRGLDDSERKSRPKTAEMRVPDGPTKQDKIVREKQVQEALGIASRERFARVTRRSGLGKALIRALSGAGETPRRGEVVLRKRIQETIHNVSRGRWAKAAQRFGIRQALVRALSGADEPSWRDKVALEAQIQEALHIASKERLERAAPTVSPGS